MKILAVDPGTRLGFAYGELGETPESGAFRLIKGPHGAFDAAIALSRWLTARLQESPVDIVAREMPYNPRFARSIRAGIALQQFADVIEQVCRRFAIPCQAIYPSTARKAFCGIGTGPDGEMKRMVIRQCKTLDWVEQDCFDDDRCDALCLWFYAEQQHSLLLGESIKCVSKRKRLRRTPKSKQLSVALQGSRAR